MAAHAVVIGGSVAGLLAARAVSDAYESVTVIDRDALPPVGRQRRGVPQGRQAHILLASGQACIDSLLPGLIGELVESGAPTLQPLTEMRLTVAGHPMPRIPVGSRAVLASRPLIEGLIRRRVGELAGVEIHDRREAVGLEMERDRVTGVRVRSRDDPATEETLPADLVVAATGGSDLVPGWLSRIGVEAPAEQRLPVHIRYVSRRLRLKPEALDGDKLIGVTPRPGCPRQLALLAQEGGEWLLGAQGYGDDRPPLGLDELLDFLTPIATPDILAAIREAEIVGDVATHGFAASRRRRYERLRSFPEGLVVIGDALCTFNPVYAQGMSVAALEAEELRRCLAEGDERLAERFFASVAPLLDQAWDTSVGSDLALPEVAASRGLRVRLQIAYARRVQAAAERDPVVTQAFMRVIGLLEPSRLLLRPDIALRVLRASRRQRPRPAPGARLRRRGERRGVRRAGRSGARARSPSR